MQFGRFFEEFEVGAVYRHWPGKTVTESDDHLFCLITMNHHPLHLDAHYAQTATQFDIRSIPTIMAVRDGVIVFEQPGALPEQALESLISQVKALDMDEVRRQVATQTA